MGFIKSYLYWIIGGLVLVGGVSVGAFYYNSTPDGETEYIITPLDDQGELDIFPYDFPNYNWLENFPEEFKKIAPPTSNGRVDTPTSESVLSPTETPWEQGPSDGETQISELSLTKPPALPSSDGTPWGQGPSDQ